MLPDPDDQPVVRNERRVVSDVALPVGLELPTPPLRVRLRDVAVFRTTVPEASVNLDGDSRTGEHDVRPARQTADVDSEAEASSVQFAADGKLRCCAGGALPGHERRYVSAGGWRTIGTALGGHR